MRVIGVDVAGGRKGTAVYQRSGGSEMRVEPSRLDKLLEDARAGREPTLICWDAPLTGPSATQGPDDSDMAYSQRPIETFFRKMVPKGISVRGYSGVSHWAVTRALVGLPVVGPFDQEPRFPLVHEGSSPSLKATSIAEGHPALALWLWMREDPTTRGSWVYKKERAVRTLMARAVLEKAKGADLDEVLPDQRDLEAYDDILDSFTLYLLGRLWLGGGDQVMVLGDRFTGAMLVPYDAKLREEWTAFLAAR